MGSNPAFAVAGIVVVAVVSSAVGHLIPFCRDELGREGAARLKPLDGLRGILCFAVLFHHAAVTREYLLTGQWRSPQSVFYRLLGETSLAFFFCVTGFLFWSRALHDRGRQPPLQFLRSRCFRLVPMYLFSAATALVVAGPHIRYLSLSAYKGIGKVLLMGVRPWGMIGSFDFGAVDARVTWSLQFEWAFYLAMPALAIFIAAGKPLRLLFAGAAFLVLIGNDRSIYFASGMIAAHVARNSYSSARLRTRAVAAAVILIIASLPIITRSGYGMIAIIATTAAFIPIASGNSLFGVLQLRSLRLMGIVSYSVYLMHGIGMYVGRPQLSRWAVTNPVPRQNLIFWAEASLIAVAILLISILTYRFVELPFILFDKRLRTATSVPPGVSRSTEEGVVAETGGNGAVSK
jgi:peptidoglycan/LPS O-acetylase OafA/YrhL